MNTAVISLGSNIHPEKNIRQAMDSLGQQFPIIRESRFVRTRPIGMAEQPDFINGAVLVETSLTRDLFKKSLQAIETQLGRRHGGPKFGPRTIDLDILVWNDHVVDQDFYSRDFLKNAVLEVLPDLR